MPAGRGMGGNKRLIQMGGNTVFKVTLNGGKKPRTGIVPVRLPGSRTDSPRECNESVASAAASPPAGSPAGPEMCKQ
jgi:hypothetical protein